MTWYVCPYCGIGSNLDATSQKLKTKCKYCGYEGDFELMVLREKDLEGKEKDKIHKRF